MSFLPHTREEENAMLQAIGVSSAEELFRDIPRELRLNRPLQLPAGLPEKSVWEELQRLAAKDRHTDNYLCFSRCRCLQHYQPSAVKHLLSVLILYAYAVSTEISQGTLQAIFEYQTCICECRWMWLMPPL